MSILFWNCEVRVLRIEVLAVAMYKLHIYRIVVRCWAVMTCLVTRRQQEHCWPLNVLAVGVCVMN
jgi:hypothetical protein